MKSFAIAAFAGIAAALPQGVTEKIAPQASAPQGCQTSYPSNFSISIMNVTNSASKRDLETRQAKVLTITLDNGVLTDDQGRTGYIAANNQFQFDKPAQTGAIYTSGWSVCSNGTLALGGSAIFYQCLSGDFYNLYDESTGNQCSPIYINVLDSGKTSTGGASQIGDGQLQAATSTAGAVSQISDGQIQATTSTAAPVTQISDGQIQASTAAAPVTQISDGQIQASTAAAPVTQISDGQIQAATSTSAAKPVTQISDGQIQAPTSASGKPVTQIGDGQIQAPTAQPVTQIGDGQIQAPTGGATAARNATGINAATPSVSVYTGAAALPTFAGQALLAAGAFAMAML